MRKQLFTILLICLTTTSLFAQSFESTEGLIQGQHVARSTTLHNGQVSNATITTAWIPFGTHEATLAAERAFAPSRFTAFVHMDTVGVGNGTAPSLTLSSQVALSDTNVAYENRDKTLDLVPGGNPITTLETGQILPVPVYGGGDIRFVITVEESATVKLDLWRTY